MTPEIMVLGCQRFSKHFFLPNNHVTISTVRYNVLVDILHSIALPHLESIPNGIFQQHDTRLHTAATFNSRLWLARSSNLSPNEHESNMDKRTPQCYQSLSRLIQMNVRNEKWSINYFPSHHVIIWRRSTKLWTWLSLSNWQSILQIPG